MADSLILRGTKHIINQSGDEMQLVRPKRGGDTHQVPRWWDLKPKSVQYTAAAILKVTIDTGNVALVIPVSTENTILEIRSDGAGNFIFPQNRGVDRLAVMSEDLSTFYVEYQFAKISGGPVLKRTVNALPTAFVEPPAPPAPTFAEKVAAATYSYVVTVDGNGAYELDGVLQDAVIADVGESIVFDFSGVASNHPLAIFTDDTKTTPVTVGVEEENGVLYFEPPIAGTFSYQCINHAGMGGDITVS